MSGLVLAFRGTPTPKRQKRDTRCQRIAHKFARLEAGHPFLAAAVERLIDKLLALDDDADADSGGA